ncbi:MAG TPA: hypothetical protein VIE47_10115, partial [Methylocystis sp.]
VMLRRVASGLRMEKVRSIAMGAPSHSLEFQEKLERRAYSGRLAHGQGWSKLLKKLIDFFV